MRPTARSNDKLRQCGGRARAGSRGQRAKRQGGPQREAPTHGTGEVARLTGIDHRHLQPRGLQCAGQRRLKAAGGFHHHQRRLQAGQRIGQSAVSLGVVAVTRERHHGADRGHIDVLAGHIDAYHHA